MLAVLFCCGLIVSAQDEGSVYHLKKSLDVPLMGTSAILWIGSQYQQEQQKPLWDEDDLLDFDRNDVNPFDRPATYNWNAHASDASDILLSASFVIPAALMVDRRLRKDWVTLAVMYAEVGFTAGAITEWTKTIVRRPRPLVYNENVPTHERINKQSTYSYFSGHTSASTAFLFFTAKVIHDHSASKWVKRGAWIGVSLYSGTVAWLRIEAGKHYRTDVITGLLIGAGTGILIPQLHKSKDSTNAFAPFLYDGALGLIWVHTIR